MHAFTPGLRFYGYLLYIALIFINELYLNNQFALILPIPYTPANQQVSLSTKFRIKKYKRHGDCMVRIYKSQNINRRLLHLNDRFLEDFQ